jgi:hypothetical protein
LMVPPELVDPEAAAEAEDTVGVFGFIDWHAGDGGTMRRREERDERLKRLNGNMLVDGRTGALCSLSVSYPSSSRPELRVTLALEVAYHPPRCHPDCA